MKTLPILKEDRRTRVEQYKEGVEQTVQPLENEERAAYQLRIERSVALLTMSLKGSHVVDLGCGRAALSQHLKHLGAHVLGVDVTHNVPPGINYQKGCLPYTMLPDNQFDGVILTDVIAEIEPHLHRLTLSEAARLMNRGGWLLCSTGLDLYSHDAYEHFHHLMQTEFTIISTKKSFHRLHFYLSRWCGAPFRFIRASAEPSYRLQQSAKRSGFLRLWFRFNSCKTTASFWKPIVWLMAPFKNLVIRNRKFLLICERISHMIWGNGALTHVIVLARKKKIEYNY